MKSVRKKLLAFVLALAMVFPALAQAMPVSAAEVDNTTTLADGEYTVPESGFVWGGGTGKAKLYLDKVVVSGGKATGYFTASSANFTHVYYGGHMSSGTDDPAYYDPGTDTMGAQVVPVTSKQAVFPVVLNQQTDIACRTVAMGEPHWVQYNYTITLDETPAEEDADYTAVDEALAGVPADLSAYTEESAAAVTAAVNAVVRGKKASEQAAVDAMASAINDAVDALVPAQSGPEKTELSITNNISMFKAVSASLETENGQTVLVMALSGNGYHELFKGTYEAAVANGANTGNWIHGKTNAEGQWEFRIPVSSGESYIPLVAVSDNYYNKYLQGQNSLDRAFYPRQVTLDAAAAAIVVDDYHETSSFTVISNIEDFKTEGTAVTDITGGPNSNNYAVAPTLVMSDDTYDKVTYPTVSGGSVTTAEAVLSGGCFAISLVNAPNHSAFQDKKPVEMTFHVAESAPYEEANTDVVRRVTIDKSAKTITIDGEPLTAKAAPEDGSKELAIENKINMFKAVSATLETKDGKTYIRMALSGTGYKELFTGTYEEAVKNGDGTADNGNDTWIHGYENADGKWEFLIPVEDYKLDGRSIPLVAVSDKNYQNYLKDKNNTDKEEKDKARLEAAFFPRQIQVDKEALTLVTDDLNVTEELTVKNNSKSLTVDKAELNTVGGPNSNNYLESLILSVVQAVFTKAFIGTAAAAAGAEAAIAKVEGTFTLPMRKNVKGGETEFDYLEQDLVVSFYDSSANTWKEFKLNASKENMLLTVSALAEDEEIVNPTPAPTPEPPKNDGTTAAVDSSTGLADGNYTPDSFSFSGGTGKLNITCTNISVRNGQAYATLQFSSKNITYVKASGATYYTQPSGSGTSVEIPVELNKNNRIIAQTVAMSTAHEIEYSIFPYLAAAAGVNAAEIGDGMTIGEEGKLDDKAPVIPGLTGGVEMKLENSEYLKIFKYDGGISLIEIDMTKNSVLDPEYLEKHKDENADDADAAEAAEDEEIINEETGEAEAKPAEEYVADQYRKDIVKYLVAPEKAELPAGLEKQVIIIRKPAENLYTSSEEATAALDKLGLLDLVKTLGMEEENIENENLKDALKDEKISLAGKADEPDYKTLVKERTGMGFMTGTLLPLNEDVMKDRNLTPDETAEELTAKEYKDRLYGMTDKYATLGIPVLMDRSADEKNEKGAAEWIMVYGLLFDKEEEAKTILDNTLKELD